MGPAREAGCIVHTYSDGDVRALVDDLIAARFARKTCVDLDVDRQSVTRFGTPDEIDAVRGVLFVTLGTTSYKEQVSAKPRQVCLQTQSVLS